MKAGKDSTSLRGLVLRILAFELVFLLFHFAYGWWPSAFTAIFSGIDESVFQHMKIGFYAWVVVSLGEAAIVLPGELGTFASSRLFSAVMGPWAFTLVWYLAPAIVGPMPNDLAEILWANLVVLVTGLFMAKLEDRLSERKANAFFLASSLVLTVVFVFLSLRFTAQRPWVDLFAPPARQG